MRFSSEEVEKELLRVTHFAEPSDPFDMLGVAKDASQDDVRKRFDTLSLMLHPDMLLKFPLLGLKYPQEAAGAFQEVVEAYEQIKTRQLPPAPEPQISIASKRKKQTRSHANKRQKNGSSARDPPRNGSGLSFDEEPQTAVLIESGGGNEAAQHPMQHLPVENAGSLDKSNPSGLVVEAGATEVSAGDNGSSEVLLSNDPTGKPAQRRRRIRQVDIEEEANNAPASSQSIVFLENGKVWIRSPTLRLALKTKGVDWVTINVVLRVYEDHVPASIGRVRGGVRGTELLWGTKLQICY